MKVARTLIAAAIGIGVSLAFALIAPDLTWAWIVFLLTALCISLYVGYRSDQKKIQALRALITHQQNVIENQQRTIHAAAARLRERAAVSKVTTPAERRVHEAQAQHGRIEQALATLEAKDPEFMKRCTIAGMHAAHARAHDVRYWCDGRGEES